jgi:hypothetical protein
MKKNNLKSLAVVQQLKTSLCSHLSFCFVSLLDVHIESMLISIIRNDEVGKSVEVKSKLLLHHMMLDVE